MSSGPFPVKRRTVSLMRSSSPAAIASCHPSDNSTRHAGSPDLFLHSRPVSRSELVERALDALADCLEHFKAREFLVVRLHERPGGASGRRALDHVGGGRLVEIPLLAVTPVLRRDLEALEPHAFALLEAPELLLPGDLHPELAQHGRRALELLLEIVDLRIGAHPVGLRAEALDALDEHTPVPGAVVNRDAALAR